MKKNERNVLESVVVLGPSGKPKFPRGNAPTGKPMIVRAGDNFRIRPDFSIACMDNEPELLQLYLQPFSVSEVGEGLVRVVSNAVQECCPSGNPFETPFGAVEVIRRLQYLNGGIEPTFDYNEPPTIEVWFDALTEEMARRLQIAMVITGRSPITYVGVIDDYYHSEWNEDLTEPTYVQISRWLSESSNEPVVVMVPEDESVFEEIVFSVSLSHPN